ncbi:MAG TPA: T9SS type A sorting domain-containing protein [bacterium]|nr:T9SS type A sorting domain-containing protein [bacterium]
MHLKSNLKSISKVSAIFALLLVFGMFAMLYADAPTSRWLWPTKTVAIGELNNYYNNGGAKFHVYDQGLAYPGWYQYVDYQNGHGIWIGASGFDDGQQTWTFKASHVGYRTPGSDEMYPQSARITSKLDPSPTVIVDGLQSFKYPVAYDSFATDMNADVMVEQTVNTLIGLTLHRTVWAFTNEYHDNYHIIQYVFENTGVAGEPDDDIEIPEQTLDGIYIGMVRNYAMAGETGNSLVGYGANWGRNTINDVIGDDMSDWYEDTYPDLRGQYAWLGYEPTNDRVNTIGVPMAYESGASEQMPGDTTGRLHSPNFAGVVTLHADDPQEAADDVPLMDRADDPTQPSMTGHVSNGGQFASNDATDETKLVSELSLLTSGHASHADLIVGEAATEPEPREDWMQRMADQTSDPGTDIEGRLAMTGYGPYTLDPGEKFRIVQAIGLDGLDDQAALEIGEQYKILLNQGNPDGTIEFDSDRDGTIEPDEQRSKNMWVMTARDSLIDTWMNAKANYESGFSIPSPPKPPRTFTVTSKPDEIDLTWELYEGESPQGFEIYRTRNFVNSFRGSQYELIDELDGSATNYVDDDVTRGVSYFYYMQVVGAENTDGTANTPTGVPLKSNRQFTQTYNPAILKRQPGAQISDVKIVPNPYNLNADKEIRWPDVQDKIGFLEIPGQCDIKIYTEVGQLVRTIEHRDLSGDEYWNLTTDANQVVSSGIYIVVIEDLETGNQIIKKMVIIR